MQVVNGLSNTLVDENIQVMYIELHDKGGYTPEDLISTVKSFGFNIKKRDGYIKAEK